MAKKIVFLFFIFLLVNHKIKAQVNDSKGNIMLPTPPMGWMTWNLLADRVNEKDLREIADAMVASGMVKVGYDHIFIDDGWQGGRDNRNNMIPDPQKFPSGIKALADYVHERGIKLGIYSDAAPLTCAGYTASLHFEVQDAKTFARWGVDYLKYDYCGAPEDSVTAKNRYKAIADALRKSGRDIALGVCEWGPRFPWLWAAKTGGQLWRTTYDLRDKWKRLPTEPWGEGIMDVVDINAELDEYAGPGHWNDPDMLVVGLHGIKGPSGDGGGTGCTDVEYQSQMSLWAIMNGPLIATNDIRNMNETTKRILLNEEIIAINQDALGKQAKRIINNKNWNVFLKPLSNGDYAIAILNRGDSEADYNLNFSELGLKDQYDIRDLWQHESIEKNKKNRSSDWKGSVQSHETKMFRLKRK